jgi:hypothetical protein
MILEGAGQPAGNGQTSTSAGGLERHQAAWGTT